MCVLLLRLSELYCVEFSVSGEVPAMKLGLFPGALLASNPGLPRRFFRSEKDLHGRPGFEARVL